MFIAFGNAFAGGVMLAAGLVHMLSDAIAGFGGSARIPLILCFTGVMIPFALEKGGLIWFMIKHPEKSAASSQIAGHGLLSVSERPSNYMASSTNPRVHQPAVLSHSHSHSRDDDDLGNRTTCVVPAVVSTHLQVRLDFLREASNQSLDVVDHASTVVPKSAHHSEMLTDDDEIFAETHDDAIRGTRHTHFSAAWIMLTVILVFHSVLAGFTLGIQSPTGTPALFLALLLHKVFESVAMGIASTQASNETNFMKKSQFVTYCLAAPFGVMLGRAFSESSDAPSSDTRALLTAVTSVSFMAICVFVELTGRVESFTIREASST
jgi:zinc transporter ZupT